MRLRLWMSAVAVVLASGVAVAQMQVVALMPDQVTWGPAPGLPADWRIAVLMGDPAKAGPYVQRVKLPPNAMIPPHTHPDDENITVLSGAFGIGEGEVANQAKGRVLPADRSIICLQIWPTLLGLAPKVRLCRFMASARVASR
jgi:quercetin dioxygenase-like cupin family protein